MSTRKNATTNNNTKTDKVLTFSPTDIEKYVSDAVIGTPCDKSKYFDGKNGYVGIKKSNKIEFSMFGIKNENSYENRKIGCTPRIFDLLKSEYENDKNVKFTENGNSSSPTIFDLIETDYETYKKMVLSVIKYFTPSTATK